MAFLRPLLRSTVRSVLWMGLTGAAFTACLGRSGLDQPEFGYSFDAGIPSSEGGTSGAGASGSGGSAAGSSGASTGGADAFGGFPSTGAITGAGGFIGNTGGFLGVGGFLGSGGVIGVGGSSGSSGAGGIGAGGTPNTGGVVSTGGRPGSGGVSSTGGAAGTGGSVDGGAPCGPANCTGCCDAAGTCRAGDNANACGLAGVACLDCGSSGFGCDQGNCQGTPPTCSAANCPGCCDAEGRCQLGTDVDACGVKGGACTDCATKGEGCSAGACHGKSPACDASSCGGCCDRTGKCQMGTSDTVCGEAGASCENCTASDRKCNQPGSYCAFIPGCSALTCPTGCCDANGVCQNGRTDATCGTAADSCTSCTASGEHCSTGGFCYTGPHCGPDNCGGCCTANGRCAGGDAARNCGRFGNECVTCNGHGQACTNGACSTKGATCPAPYAGCNPSLLTAPPKESTSCRAADLKAVAKACAGTTASATCKSELAALTRSNAGCFDCLQQFLSADGVAKCLAPFMTSTCNHDFTCATGCLTTSCGSCGSADDQANCQSGSFMSGGQCAAFLTGFYCAEAAYSGPAAFCDEGAIRDIGTWLQGVGAHYCGP